MAFVDRLVEFPGRIQLVPVAGQTNVYDVVRAEGTVTEAGTPLNADNLNSNIIEQVNSLLDPAIEEAIGGFRVSEIQAGTVTVPLKNNSSVNSITVRFPTAFRTTPKVVVCPVISNPNTVRWSLNGASLTGFTLRTYSTANVNTNFFWIAIS